MATTHTQIRTNTAQRGELLRQMMRVKLGSTTLPKRRKNTGQRGGGKKWDKYHDLTSAFDMNDIYEPVVVPAKRKKRRKKKK